ncbi:MAG: hypothetical protein HYU43_07170 [Armatimonadetes bacterium]|nr:hypothetical protein [Armatimonadota bacterium]
MQPVPWAAERWAPVTQTAVDVYLRPGMKFHDGQPMTADDVKFTYDEMKRWKVPLYVAMLQPIKQVRVLDRLRLRFELEHPYAPLYMQTFSMIPIVPRHLWENVVPRKGLKAPWEWTESQAYVGSGPFKLVHFRPGQEIKLARNDEHHRPPKARFWVLAFFANVNAEFLAFKKGIVDFTTGRGLTGPQMVEARTVPHLATVEMEDVGVYWMEFNLRENSPFRNHAFRHALAHTIDYTTIVKTILAGQGVQGRGVIAPANKFWHNPHIPSGEVEGPHYHQYDPVKARRILQEAGYEWHSRGRLYYPKDYRPQVLPRSAGLPGEVRTAKAHASGKVEGPGCRM